MPATTLSHLLGRHFDCACGARHIVPTEVVDADPGAASRLGSYVRNLTSGATVLVVGDMRTLAAGAGAISALRDARVLGLPDRGPEGPRADEETALEVGRAIDAARARFAVAIGSGTVNDLVKAAATHAEIPYAVFATAPSMNGYTSAIVALEVRGVKRTLQATPPTAVYAEPEVLAAAPAALRRAGLGDLLSKPVAGADWRMAAVLHDEPFCPFAIQIVEAIYSQVAIAAASIGRGDPEGVTRLFEGLILSGLSMVIAGASNPASGGEHLVSHWLDLQAHRAGRPTRLHGAQVGVATIASAMLYERLLQVRRVDVEEALSRYRPAASLGEALASRYGSLAPEILEAYEQKAPAPDAYRPHLERLAAAWPTLRETLQAQVVVPNAIRGPLEAAGCPTRPIDLGIPDAHFRDAIRYGREIRARHTVLDLAADLGLLDDFAATWPPRPEPPLPPERGEPDP